MITYCADVQRTLAKVIYGSVLIASMTSNGGSNASFRAVLNCAFFPFVGK